MTVSHTTIRNTSDSHVYVKKLVSVIRLMKKFCRLGHVWMCVYTHIHNKSNNNEKKKG